MGFLRERNSTLITFYSWFSIFYLTIRGHKRRTNPRKKTMVSLLLYSLTLCSFILVLALSFLQSQRLFLQSVSHRSKQSQLGTSTVVYAANIATASFVFVLCMCRCSLSFIDFEGRSDGDSIKRILSIVKPRQLVRSVVCTYIIIVTVCILLVSFPDPILKRERVWGHQSIFLVLHTITWLHMLQYSK